ncbi:MAG: hypothetical protein Q7T76_19450 [Ferruginibacter sp.]|nr:hypothetical protein [Ferruginibacter sp.]
MLPALYSLSVSSMISIHHFIPSFYQQINLDPHLEPWIITRDMVQLIEQLLLAVGEDYRVEGGVAIHRSAVVEPGAVIKAPAIIGASCFIGAHAYIRGGVFLSHSVKIGTGCEIKSSIVCSGSAIAHFNFIGDSIIGSNVNFEAGSITANHYNERTDKSISVVNNGNLVATGCTKFGALVGDGSRVGANAVLSPGTLLPIGSIVKRLELIDQQAPFSA